MPNIPLVDNLWGYAIYWIFRDVFDLIQFGPHLYVGYREYFGGTVGPPVFALFTIVGAFLDLRILWFVVGIVFAFTPTRMILNTFLWLMRILDRFPII